MFTILSCTSGAAGPVTPGTLGAWQQGANSTTIVSLAFTLVQGYSLNVQLVSAHAGGGANTVPSSVVWSLGGGQSLGAALGTVDVAGGFQRRLSWYQSNQLTAGAGTITVTWADTQLAPCIRIFSIANVNAATPVDTGTVQTDDIAAGVGPLSTTTPSQLNDLVISMFASAASAVVLTPSSGALLDDDALAAWGVGLLSKSGEANAVSAGSYNADSFGAGIISANFNRAGTQAPSVATSLEVTAEGGGNIGVDQIINSPFNIRIRMLDQYGNVFTGFTGTVDVSSTGSLSAGSGTTAAFVAGVLASHTVQFNALGSGLVINVADTATGLITGQSNTFDILAAGTWSLIETRDYTALTKPGWYDAAGNWALSGDGQSCIATFPAGLPGGSGAHDEAFAIPTPTRAGRVELAFTFAADYNGNPSGFNKVMWLYVNDLALVYFDANGSGTGPFGLNVNIQGTVSPGTTNYASGSTFPVDAFRSARLDILGNTAATANGQFRLWISTDDSNFTLVLSQTNIQWTAGASLVTQFSSGTVWGGLPGPNPAAFTMAYHNCRIYTANSF